MRRVAILEREAHVILSVADELIGKLTNIGSKNAIGPRGAVEPWREVFPASPEDYAYPWEDIRLRD
jgi:hypothetical protein